MCICKWRINKASRKAIIWPCSPQHSAEVNRSEKCHRNSNSNCNNSHGTIIETGPDSVNSTRKRFSGFVHESNLARALAACPRAQEPHKLRPRMYRSQRPPSRLWSLLVPWNSPAPAFSPQCPSCSLARDTVLRIWGSLNQKSDAIHFLKIIKVTHTPSLNNT